VQPPPSTSAARVVVPVTAVRASDVQLTPPAPAPATDDDAAAAAELPPTLFSLSSASSSATSTTSTSSSLAEELQLRLYRFDKRAAAAGARVLQAAHYRHAIDATAAGEAAELGVALAHCENVARFWADLPANWLTPRLFVDAVRELFAGLPGVRVRVLDEHELLARGFGGLLGVAAGSREPARLLVLDVGDVASVPAARLPTLVGKGVTFDAGGISIKPAKDMYAMKADMTGAAAVCAAAFGAAQLGAASSCRSPRTCRQPPPSSPATC
jgi:leucyl aminopeptidase